MKQLLKQLFQETDQNERYFVPCLVGNISQNNRLFSEFYHAYAWIELCVLFLHYLNQD